MSKHIPTVKTWRVRYFQGRRCIFDTLVRAPNKMFARWAARDAWLSYRAADKVRGNPPLDLPRVPDRRTVSLWKVPPHGKIVATI